jgi:valyl-tRNA synthetase
MLPNGPYNAKETEERILKFWLDNKFYKPEYNSQTGSLDESLPAGTETYTITMPPPNANGNLHLGHVSGYSYQDLMGRYQRMQGKRVLLLPGKDHAGIQTEVVYEKELDKKGLTKQMLGREEFYKQTYDFCIENAANARAQEQRIGTSADFDRELFTLDPVVVDDVLNAFMMMHEDGLIYRGKRLINWCPRCQSALADIDTEYKDSKTNFFYFKYAFAQPEPKALELKHEFETKTDIIWRVTENLENTSYLTGETHKGVKILGVGYDNVPAGNELAGKVIGIQMRLDGDFHLVVSGLDFEGNIKPLLGEAFKELIGKVAGSHIILFDEYTEDKFYTNGFVLGTVRPETKFGDTAIAANPKDERYAEFVGKQFEVQTLNGLAKINFIADDAVDMAFGTGLIKVTPAHAQEDWDIAMRHPAETLPEKQVIGFDGKLNHLTGKYEGVTVNEARRRMVDDMREIGMLVHLDENYENRTQICERCKSRIEPLISHQWFVDTKPLKAKAKKLVEDGLVNIMPEGRKNVYLQWMDSPEDWCITRQLWWGYRIPVWYKGGKSEYVTPTGEVKEKIGETIIESPTDYAGLMHVGVEQPGSTSIHFIRHAQSESNANKTISSGDVSLSPAGEKAAAEIYLEKGYDVIISSSLLRARQTAEIIAQRLGLEVVIDDQLVEQDIKSLAGSTHDEVMKKYGAETIEQGLDLADADLPETWQALTKRAELSLQRITDKYKGKKVLVISHERFIRALSNLQGTQTTLPNLGIYRLSITNDATWIQDPDVLDTWFSSGQWPFVTLDVREGDLERFYPTQTMETGWDILIFWVTRMMMLSTYRAEKAGLPLEQQAPFKDVYLHGLVLDKEGQKMSKSKGNGIEPNETIEKYGADALRFSFIAGGAAGQNVRLYDEKVSSNARFMNKIWNASKFAMMNLEGVDVEAASKIDAAKLVEETNKELFKHIVELKENITHLYNTFQFGVAGQILFNEFWHSFADIHIEAAKQHLQAKKDKVTGEIISEPTAAAKTETGQVLWFALHEYLKMLHPLIPFITEEIWQHLDKPAQSPKTLMYVRW